MLETIVALYVERSSVRVSIAGLAQIMHTVEGVATVEGLCRREQRTYYPPKTWQTGRISVAEAQEASG